MMKSLAGVIGCGALLACASNPPTEHLAASMASVRGAETAGAANVPQAALHLKLAQEEIAQAQKLIEEDENERADGMTQRATMDADLALALTREAQIKQQRLSYAESQPQTNVQPAINMNPPAKATTPPGGAAPNTPPSPTGK